MFSRDKHLLKHNQECLGSHGDLIVLWNCLKTSDDQHWELSTTTKLFRHKYVEGGGGGGGRKRGGGGMDRVVCSCINN